MLDNEYSAEEEDNLAGLELVEDQETRSNAMDLDGDDMLAQMEARLARLSSRVSFDFQDANKPFAHVVENGYWHRT